MCCVLIKYKISIYEPFCSLQTFHPYCLESKSHKILQSKVHIILEMETKVKGLAQSHTICYHLITTNSSLNYRHNPFSV